KSVADVDIAIICRKISILVSLCINEYETIAETIDGIRKITLPSTNPRNRKSEASEIKCTMIPVDKLLIIIRLSNVSMDGSRNRVP
ncbi:MAG: hypothetical protein ACFE7E_07995, partial [Candidatus Hodarchaeota archaeon]